MVLNGLGDSASVNAVPGFALPERAGTWSAWCGMIRVGRAADCDQPMAVGIVVSKARACAVLPAQLCMVHLLPVVPVSHQSKGSIDLSFVYYNS